jgi:pseudouridine synthase
MARKRIPKWLEAARATGAAPAPGEKADWVSRVLARSGLISPEQIDTALRAGRVTVAGRAVYTGMVLVSKNQEVRLDRELVPRLAGTLVLMLHKPVGLVCAKHDPEGVGTVFGHLASLLTPELTNYGWHAVGRLDRNTTGLLLFTNDERVVTHVTSPETHLPKRYVATVAGKVDDAKLAMLRTGVQLEDGMTRPAIAELRAPDRIALTLTEGRNHQVKRMLGAIGLPVLALHRERIGDLDLDVDLGQMRRLTEEDVTAKLGFVPDR